MIDMMTWMDLAIIATICISIIIGLIRGFVREVLSVTAWVIALWATIVFSDNVAGWLSSYIDSKAVIMGVSFSAVFLSVLIAFTIINFLIFHIVKVTGLSGTDRLIGMVFGGLRGVLLIGILILVAHYFSFTKEVWWKQSQLIPYFKPMSTWIMNFIPKDFGLDEKLKEKAGDLD